MRGWGMGGLRIKDAKSRRLCGRRPGLFLLAKDARRGEPSTGLDEVENRKMGEFAATDRAAT